MPAMPVQTPEQLAQFVQQTFGRLDQFSYFDLLGIPSGATQLEIRAAFYRVSRDLHPDRHQRLADRELKDRLETIYARMCEGYRVLSTPEKRSAYLRVLGEGKKRLTNTDRDSHRPQNPEDSIKHEEAKKFYRLGMLSLGSKDFKGAVMNFNFAKSFEPNAAVIKLKLSEAQAALGKPGGSGTK
jgi:curved DNA-binding protein CbpA